MTALALAGVYERKVRASLARIWENVFDWEHLPSLHAHDFAACTLLDCGDWGWRARLVSQPGDETRAQVIELRADVPARRYCTTTLEGPGARSEIRVALTPQTQERTNVRVEFHVPETTPERLAVIGARYVEIYARLWDEDEAMMRERTRALARRKARTAARPRRLGLLADVRVRLPLTVTFGGERFRIVDLDGALVAHALTCPHWLGPLDGPVENGRVRCPWHDYVFDVASGASCDGRGLKLAPAPQVEVRDGVVTLR
jgi:nitrite reductase/ring-hydroxylating ferredoxin subunit